MKRRGREQQLRKDRGEKYRAGLQLAHVLLTGDEAPPCWPNGHLKDCACIECGRFKYRLCPYCGEYPCSCA